MFAFVSLLPGNPARVILGPNATGDEVQALTTQLGLDQPVYVQYWNWLLDALRGDLGTSLYNGQPVTDAVAQSLPVTASLGAASIVVIAAFGITLGVASAVRGGWFGRFLDVLVLLGFAIPHFWLGLVLVGIFSSALGWFPAIGYVSIWESPAGWAYSLVLPVAMLAIGGITAVAKQTRESMLDTLRSDYIDALRAQGLSRPTILFKHALRNAAIPVTTVIGLVFVSLLSGSVLAEQIFVLPGLGRLTVEATTKQDLPMVQGTAVVFVLLVIVVNLLVDLAYGWLNPKVRTSS